MPGGWAVRLDDAHVLLTGGSRGIGLALAERLRSRGVRITLVARSPQRLDGIAGEIGGAAVPADLADPRQVATVITRAEVANGPVDVLINNAALMVPGPLVHMTAEDVRSIVTVNTIAPLELARGAM